jgi:hypothetical protein
MSKVDDFLKWLATAILIIGTAVNSAGFYPQGPILLLLGGLVWFTVALRWREPALIVTNGIMSLTGVIGLVYAALN